MNNKIYALYPLDENKRIAGVYVGTTSDVKRRMKEHVYSNTFWIGNKPATDFVYQVLDETDDPRLEYDYIDLLGMTGLPLLNKKIGNHSDYRRALSRLLNKIDFYRKSR